MRNKVPALKRAWLIKAAEVKDLGHGRVCQQGLQIGGVIGLAVQADHMGIAIAGRKLHQTKRVSPETQAKRLRIHRNTGHALEEARRQVAFMQ